MAYVNIVAGKLNKGENQILYWKAEKIGAFKIGDFAIVENKNSWDLIEIVGNVCTTEENARCFSKTCYKNMKNVVRLIQREELVKEKESNE